MKAEFPEDRAELTWEKDGLVFSIVEYGHYCGYVRFPARPTIEDGYNGILTYVPVHGGITFARDYPDGSMVYGFDCAHHSDSENPLTRDIEWLKSECERMAVGIQEAAKIEAEYLTQPTTEKRAALLDLYHTALRDSGVSVFSLSDNFGAMINAMGGSL